MRLRMSRVGSPSCEREDVKKKKTKANENRVQKKTVFGGDFRDRAWAVGSFGVDVCIGPAIHIHGWLHRFSRILRDAVIAG